MQFSFTCSPDRHTLCNGMSPASCYVGIYHSFACTVGPAVLGLNLLLCMTKMPYFIKSACKATDCMGIFFPIPALYRSVNSIGCLKPFHSPTPLLAKCKSIIFSILFLFILICTVFCNFLLQICAILFYHGSQYELWPTPVW